MEVSSEAVLVGAGVAAGSFLWWLLRGRTDSPSIVDPSLYTLPVAKVTKLCVYPVKSCRRIEVPSSECYKRGLLHDRTWAIIDKDGSFCSQRRLPSMAKIQPTLKPLPGGGVQLTLSAPGMDDIIVPTPEPSTAVTQVKVWNMSGEGRDVGDAVSLWLSQFLQLEGCRMYYMAPSNQPRRLRSDSRFDDCTQPGDETSFSDWSPVLVISEESLELLNSKVDTNLVMERFRANIIVSGCLPHSEDTWSFIKLGSVVMRGVKPCGRCKMTKVDPELGVETGEEPIATLTKYRLHNEVYECEPDPRFGQNPLFGYNFVPILFGTVSVGDTIYKQSS